MAGGMAGPGGARGGSGSNSGSSTAGNTGASAANSAASSASGMSIGFGGGLSGFSNSDQGGAGGWTSNSFGSGVNATGSGTSVSAGSSGSGSDSSSGQTFGEQITSGGEDTGPSPADIEAQFKEEARKKTAEDAAEARDNEMFDTAEATRKSKNLDYTYAGVGEEEGKNLATLQSIMDAMHLYTPPASDTSKAAPSTSGVTSSADTNTAISNLGTLSFTGLLDSFASPNESNEGTNEQAQSSGGLTNRGSTVSTYGTGGSISSGLSVPERDTESIGLGVYDPDKANYDQDNWNRGMEQQSSSVVSDEQCKQFAMRAFHENSPAFKVVKTTIIKKLD